MRGSVGGLQLTQLVCSSVASGSVDDSSRVSDQNLGGVIMLGECSPEGRTR